MRCLLARRRREKSIDAKMGTEIFTTFQEDIRQKFLICHQLPEGLAAGAVNLLSVLSDIPLRTLDVLHLAIAKDLTVDILATADHIMASGAKAMGISVVRF
jgi:hypothetical protein